MTSEYLYSVRSLDELRKQFPDMTVKAAKQDQLVGRRSQRNAAGRSNSGKRRASSAKKKLVQ
jgi:hypothetical protein